MNTNMDQLELFQAEATANSIFRPDRRAGAMVPLLTGRLPTRALGFPFYQVDLTETQWANFVAALRIGGYKDAEAFATVLFTVEGYWKVALDAGAYPYPELIRDGWPSVFESAIYSREGHWALAVSPNEFAIAAGDSRFIQALEESMPEFTEHAAINYMRYWREGNMAPRAQVSRVELEILEHVYGLNAARRMQTTLASPDDEPQSHHW